MAQVQEVAIRISKVAKNFAVPHEKTSSIKSLFTSLVKGLNRSKATQVALRDISFEIKKGEFFGVVGRNGSGKSTLLKILAGIYQPTSGKVEIQGRLVPFIELGVGFNPELTGRENVYLNGAMLGFSKKEVDKMYPEIVAFAELERFMDQKLKNYSSGMQVRLAFSMAIRAEADVLLVDEVLAVGDADFQRKCYDYFRSLKKNKKTVVFVSHDMTAVREYCDRAVLIEKNELVLEGNANEVATAYTKMFIEQGGHEKADASSKQWGDGCAKFDKVTIDKKRLSQEDSQLKITTTAVIKESIENPVFGFSIKNASNQQILGTNTQIKRQSIKKLSAGYRVSTEWIVPNVFNDGKHYIDVAIIYDDGTSVAEWWEEAASFNVAREEKTPYIITPFIELKLETSEPDGA